ncbi:PAXIP1-associated glutamate-rich protein 1A [Orchesella cincta]|uniref:PAXIP1-associated glutamate-rich protein 1A n=1 Tax=Orchesella cincta TaxID=48709 RepID=A0A1D2NH94_ORCCI|nr:PAXIP1-associated glutamate-rich protein 1A [Orchesella cincta]
MDDVILAECSDEEEFARSGSSYGNTWSPKVHEVELLYQRIKNEKVIEFRWKPPPRRNPNEKLKSSEECEKPVVELLDESGAYDFDFDDDAGPLPQKLPSKSNTPKNVTKKRTTTLAGIVANMEKHRIMDKMGAEAEASPSKQ